MTIHFVGIGGVSMSALAMLTRARGAVVTGSDRVESGTTVRLRRGGIPVAVPGGRLPVGTDRVVRTSAVPDTDPEIVAARSRRIPVVERAEALGEIAAGYGTCFAVAGAHGKTTASGALAKILLPRDPTLHIGGEANFMTGSCRVGGTAYFVTEACEYRRNFLTLRPDVAVVLNIDADHLDYFRDIDDICDAFAAFAANVRPGGLLAVNGDDPRAAALPVPTGVRRVTFGLAAHNDYTAADVAEDDYGIGYTVLERGAPLCAVRPGIQGRHNVYNILAAVAAARVTPVTTAELVAGITDYYGMDRRYQTVGTLNGARLIIDYAHHPAELKSVLTLAKRSAHKRLWAVFQPHTYSRTRALLPAFADSLDADEILLCPIYAAREAPIEGVTSRALEALIKQKRPSARVRTAASLPAAAAVLRAEVASGDLVLILGAGDVVKITEMVARNKA
ncbi:MAG: UDP-N-acetylmuramate--L-alanine ligase [Clostridiales bacterium]|jgi:UDP-N-acetylmuramate--alanine ligase|nr:UDP-N-acetylmuramate--L-alanine ligase [Clostridiales bacterium]